MTLSLATVINGALDKSEKGMPAKYKHLVLTEKKIYASQNQTRN